MPWAGFAVTAPPRYHCHHKSRRPKRGSRIDTPQRKTGRSRVSLYQVRARISRRPCDGVPRHHEARGRRASARIGFRFRHGKRSPPSRRRCKRIADAGADAAALVGATIRIAPVADTAQHVLHVEALAGGRLASAAVPEYPPLVLPIITFLDRRRDRARADVHPGLAQRAVLFCSENTWPEDQWRRHSPGCSPRKRRDNRGWHCWSSHRDKR